MPGTRTGAIVSLGLVLLAWLAIPIARPFIVGTVGLGLVVGQLAQPPSIGNCGQDTDCEHVLALYWVGLATVAFVGVAFGVSLVVGVFALGSLRRS